MTVCAQLYFNIWKEIGLKLDNKHWCDHVPKLMQSSAEGKVRGLRNPQVQTDRTIRTDKPYTLIRDKEKGTWLASSGTVKESCYLNT
jgi:hypothetical protein